MVSFAPPGDYMPDSTEIDSALKNVVAAFDRTVQELNKELSVIEEQILELKDHTVELERDCEVINKDRSAIEDVYKRYAGNSD